MGIKIKDNKLFLGKMNKDVTPNLLPQQDYIEAYNVRVNSDEKGEIGSVDSIKGNLLVEDSIFEKSRCIGACINTATDEVIYFLYSLDLYTPNRIVNYNIKTKEIKIIAEDKIDPNNPKLNNSVFRFYNNALIKANIIGNLLYFNDGINPPRKINIDKFYKKSLNWEFFDNAHYEDNIFKNEQGYIAFVSETKSPFNIGDFVFVNQYGTPTHEEYNGYAEVVYIGMKYIVPDNKYYYYVVIDKYNLGITPPEGGIIYKIDGISYYDLKESYIKVVKAPPLEPPKVKYVTISDNKFYGNNIKDSLWQFAYRYIYDDNEYSVLSPYSKIALPTKQTLTGLGIYTNEYLLFENGLNITINTGDCNVKAIEIFARSNYFTDDGSLIETNFSKWYKIALINKYSKFFVNDIPDNSEYDYLFLNDGIYNIGDSVDLSRPYDYVPIVAGEQEVIENSRLLYADILEGFDNVKIDVSIERVTENISQYLSNPQNIRFSSNSLTYVHKSEINIFSKETNIFYIYRYIDFPSNENSYDTKIFNINVIEGDDTLYTVSKMLDLSTESYDDFINYFYITLKNKYNYDNGSGKDSVVREGNRIYIYEYKITIINYFGIHKKESTKSHPYIKDINMDVTIGQQHVFKHYKYNRLHKFGIVYYDEDGRMSYVNISDSIKDTNLSFPQSHYYKASYKFIINHYPPDFASKYQIVYSKNINEYFLQFGVLKDDIYNYPQTNSIKILLNKRILDTNDYLGKKSILEPYQFYKGDRVRFIYYKRAGSDYTSYNKILDYEIVNSEDDGIYIDYYNNWESDIFPYNDIEFIGFEVYRPYKFNINDNDVYYEIGEVFDIIKGEKHNYHSGNIQNQIEGGTAIVLINSGSCYMRERLVCAKVDTNIYKYVIPVESLSFCDFYASKSTDIGKVNTVLVTAEQKRYNTMIRYSGNILQESNINNISRFLYDDYVMLPSKYGTIQRMEEIGNVLLVIQNNKTCSIYINKSELYTASDNILHTSKNILGSINYFNYNYGTQNKESVVKTKRLVYWVDVNQNAVIRYSDGSINSISDYQMTNYFNDLFNNIRNNKNIYNSSNLEYPKKYYVFGVFNDVYDEYIIHIREYHNLPNVSYDDIDRYTDKPLTILFYEKSNSWTTFLDWYKKDEQYYIPLDFIISYGGEMIQFMNGSIYLNEKNDKYLYLFDDFKDMSITFVSNKEPNIVKVYDCISINSNSRFDVEAFIEPSENYKNGMYSVIPNSRFVIKEGIYYSEFLMDANTPNFNSIKEAILNGRKLRGNYLKIKLKGILKDEYIPIKLKNVNIISTSSHRIN